MITVKYILGLAILLQIYEVYGFPSEHVERAEVPGRRVCYFGAGAMDRPGSEKYDVSDIPIDLCNYILYAFCGVNNVTWEVNVNDPERDLDQDGTPGGYRRFTDLKSQQPGLKATLSLGGWGEDGRKFSDLVSLKERRATYIESIVNLLDEYNFDGLDLDWEYPGNAARGGRPEDKENFLLFVQELREAFDQVGNGWELTAAVPVAQSNLDEGYAVEELCSLLDVIHCMTYDLRGPWVGYADVQSPLYARPGLDVGEYLQINVNDGLALWEERGCPAEKLVVGAPYYGKSYVLQDPSKHDLGAPIVGGGSLGGSYPELCLYLQSDDGWVRGYDDVGKVPYMYKDDQWIGYEDPDSLRLKMQFVKEKGYLGGMNWAIDLDDWQNKCGQGANPMMTIMYEELKDYVVPGTNQSLQRHYQLDVETM